MCKDNENPFAEEALTEECKELMKQIEEGFKKEDPLWDGIHEPEDWDKQTDPHRYEKDLSMARYMQLKKDSAKHMIPELKKKGYQL